MSVGCFYMQEDEDGSRRTKSGKRLLRTLGLVFGCVGLASLVGHAILFLNLASSH
jgi:hypothetical protein